jgi:hypothetical protein
MKKYIVKITSSFKHSKIISNDFTFTTEKFFEFKREYDNFIKIYNSYGKDCDDLEDFETRLDDCLFEYETVEDKEHMVFDDHCEPDFLILKDFTPKQVERAQDFMNDYIRIKNEPYDPFPISLLFVQYIEIDDDQKWIKI